MARLLGLRGVPPRPIPRKKSGSNTTIANVKYSVIEVGRYNFVMNALIPKHNFLHLIDAIRRIINEIKSNLIKDAAPDGVNSLQEKHRLIVDLPINLRLNKIAYNPVNSNYNGTCYTISEKPLRFDKINCINRFYLIITLIYFFYEITHCLID